MCAPEVREMKDFEKELFEMAAKVEFKNVNNKFQQELRQICEQIKSEKKLFIAADKTSN